VTRRTNLREHIRAIAFDKLKENKSGLRFSELLRQIQLVDPKLKSSTVNSSIWNLDAIFPDEVYKPSKGLFRLSIFRQGDIPALPSNQEPTPKLRIREEAFYPLFANWLKNDLEDATHAIALGRNVFKCRWGTPDVLGKSESRRSDVIKGETSIVAAEIKADVSATVTGFGQACAYRLFSHKSYLVIPLQTPQDELEELTHYARCLALGWLPLIQIA